MKLAFHDLLWLRCTPITFLWKIIEIIPQNYTKYRWADKNYFFHVKKVGWRRNSEATLRVSFLKISWTLYCNYVCRISHIQSISTAHRERKLAAIANYPLKRGMKYERYFPQFWSNYFCFINIWINFVSHDTFTFLPTKYLHRIAERDTISLQN